MEQPQSTTSGMVKLWATDSQCLPKLPKALARPVHFTKSSPYTGENAARTFDVATRSGILHRIWPLAVALLLLAGALGCGGEPQTAVTPTTQAQARATSPVPVLSIPIPVKEIRSDRYRTDSPQATDQDLETLVRGNNAFALDLYRALNDGEGNLFYSPFSISQALAMALAGARGETERQMADTLHYRLPQSGLPPRSMPWTRYSPRGAAAFRTKRTFQLKITNTIWGQHGYEFLPD